MRRISGSLDGAANGQFQPVADAPAQNDGVPAFQTRTEGLADSTYVVAVAGEIDVLTEPQFSDAVHGAIDAGAARLIVDLSDCGFMDSTGINILLGVNGRLRQSSRPVVVVADHPNVLQVLRLTAVDQVLALYATRSAALNGNGNGRA
jgi:anti-sigma B factor antagonist